LTGAFLENMGATDGAGNGAAEGGGAKIGFFTSVPASLDGFIAGFGYGATSVIVGQPFDTIKTRSQMKSYFGRNPFQIGMDIWHSEGIRGLYRGGMPLVLGGALIRSAQFGVNEAALTAVREITGCAVDPQQRWFGIFDWQIIFSGLCGGIGRGVIEGPFEYIKVRRQLMQPWHFKEVLHGSGATIARNAFLFSSFVVYLDISKQVGLGGVHPFWQGAICANLAWMTIWPMDVAKTMVQSGNYNDKSLLWILRETVTTGAMTRGLVPGLARSTVANGSAMVAYKEIQKRLTQVRLEDK
jgi:solute carrier family 25 carnitine/acylcarnitine transporter 20/29